MARSGDQPVSRSSTHEMQHCVRGTVEILPGWETLHAKNCRVVPRHWKDTRKSAYRYFEVTIKKTAVVQSLNVLLGESSNQARGTRISWRSVTQFQRFPWMITISRRRRSTSENIYFDQGSSRTRTGSRSSSRRIRRTLFSNPSSR